MKETIDRYLELAEKGVTELRELEILLSGEEKTILNVLKDKQIALNINGIRNAIIDDFIKLCKYYKKLKECVNKINDLNKTTAIGSQKIIRHKLRNLQNNPKSTESYIENEIKKDYQRYMEKYNNLIENKPKPNYWAANYEDVPEYFVSVYNEMKKLNLLTNNRRILEKDKRKVASLLKKYGIVNIPAHTTIERILKEFEASGLVMSRSESGGRGKKLYALNPKLSDHSGLTNHQESIVKKESENI